MKRSGLEIAKDAISSSDELLETLKKERDILLVMKKEIERKLKANELEKIEVIKGRSMIKKIIEQELSNDNSKET